jgi:SHS2 domain-containing protein
MDSNFEILEHTADIGLRAFGSDLAEAFVNAARGMVSLIIDPETIREVLSRELEVKAKDKEVLLVEWLNELLYFFDTEFLLFKRFEIIRISETEIRARCYGEKVDKTRHILKMGIKSTTYHLLRVEKKSDGYLVQVLLDI